ncbi:MAG: endolytic transglycosylase MltG [Proteobacteria bacterium]|nr:endolytic transglycosylase MltG [Pseudomonadota bacterium]
MYRKFISAIGKGSVYIVAFVIGIFFSFAWFKVNFINPLNSKATQEVTFIVQKDQSPTTIFKELEKQQIVRRWYSLGLFAKIKFSADSQLKILAGEYGLSPSNTPKEILDILLSGKIIQHPLTIAEGLTLNEIAAVVEKSGLATSDDIKRAYKNPNILAKYQIPSNTVEGYLFPETYNFSKPTNGEQIVSRLIDEGKKKLNDRLRGWQERAKEISFKPYDVIILASIVEKETADPTERRKIASVFHNRLRIGMPLQSDPTVIYGIDNFNGNITKEDLKRPSPYNTYLNTGLTPTPICNPGMDAIRAVLFPEDTDFLYFVGKGDGSHQFSKTYKEHQEAVNRFQKSL